MHYYVDHYQVYLIKYEQKINHAKIEEMIRNPNAIKEKKMK